MHYEDIPVTVPLYGRTRQVDVIDLPVYYWRQRPAGDPSISQRLAEQRNLDDRFAAVTFARRELSALDGPFATWYAETALQSDLRLVLEVLPDVDDAYRARFVKLAAAFLADVEPAVLTRLPGRLASAWQLTRDGDVDGLVRLVSSVRAASAPGAGMAAWRAPAAPAVRATAVDWADGRLRIELADERVPLALLWLREGAPGNRVVALPAAGGSGTLRPSRLRGRQGWQPGEWTVNVAPARDAARAHVRVTGPVPFQARWVDPSTLVAPVVRGGVLRVVVERPAVVAAEAGADDGVLRVDVDGSVAPGTLLHLERAPGVPSLAYPTVADGATWTARVPLADLAAAIGTPGVPDEPPAVWLAALGEPGAPSVPLVAGPRLTPATAGPVRTDADPRGVLRVTAV